MSVPLYWWRAKPNFGDQLAPIIVQHFAKKEVVCSEKPNKLIALGSVLGYAKNGDSIWGTGLRQEGLLSKKLVVYAVRGQKTRNFLLEQGIECPEIYGDPAILMPMIYRPKIMASVEITILPHYSDNKLQYLGEQAKLPIIHASESPKTVIDRIVKTKILVTSSLHGLILAEAYGVPVVLLRQKSQVWEPHFKFVDYFLSTGREDQTLWDISIEESVQHIPNIPKPKPIDQEKLIKAFPKDFCNKFS
ncbi:MAG: polysaccharide pyruvyl transferase family protein [Planctomycetaceae bacterium]|jgi:pyruvyltransferase|nr:polysaccharide pyruvyl transferase family protein [Planctomycetaceae bacterium]